MARLSVSVAWWEVVEPLLPKRVKSPKGGPPPVSDRVCLTGILFVLKTGLPWEDFPREMGAPEVWHDAVEPSARLARGRGLAEIARSIAGQTARSQPHRLHAGGRRFVVRTGGAWGKKTGPNPTDCGKKGRKHHLLTEGHGTPVVASVTAANRHDVTPLLPLVDAIPPLAGKVGRPLQKPAILRADRAYDSGPHRQPLRQRGIIPFSARRGVPHGSGLGMRRHVVEQTLGLLHPFRRLRTRFD